MGRSSPSEAQDRGFSAINTIILGFYMTNDLSIQTKTILSPGLIDLTKYI